MISEVWFPFCLEHFHFLNSKKSHMHCKEKIISLKPNKVEKSTLYFHKFPYLSSSWQLSNEFQLIYFYLSEGDKMCVFILRHPVYSSGYHGHESRQILTRTPTIPYLGFEKEDIRYSLWILALKKQLNFNYPTWSCCMCELL